MVFAGGLLAGDVLVGLDLLFEVDRLDDHAVGGDLLDAGEDGLLDGFDDGGRGHAVGSGQWSVDRGRDLGR